MGRLKVLTLKQILEVLHNCFDLTWSKIKVVI